MPSDRRAERIVRGPPSRQPIASAGPNLRGGHRSTAPRRPPLLRDAAPRQCAGKVGRNDVQVRVDHRWNRRAHGRFTISPQLTSLIGLAATPSDGHRLPVVLNCRAAPCRSTPVSVHPVSVVELAMATPQSTWPACSERRPPVGGPAPTVPRHAAGRQDARIPAAPGSRPSPRPPRPSRPAARSIWSRASGSGWMLKDAQGKLLRRFYSSDGRNVDT